MTEWFDHYRIAQIRMAGVNIDLIPTYAGLSLTADMLEKFERKPELFKRSGECVSIAKNFAVRFAALAGHALELPDETEAYEQRFYERQRQQAYWRRHPPPRGGGYGAAGAL